MLSTDTSSPPATNTLLIPYPKQAWTIANATARINIWDGSISAGKTVASYWRWIYFLANDEVPGSKAMIAKTERTLKRNIIDPLIEMLGEHNVRYSQGQGECYILGKPVYVVGANDARAEQKIRGITLAGILGDEITLWPEDFFVMALGRLRVPGAKLFGTTNPDSPYHYLKARFLDRIGELDIARFHFVIDDNPTLDPEYVAAVKAEYTGLWYQRYILGEWVVAEGAVYDMFEDTRHVVTELPNIARYWICIDYGTTNPFVAILLGLGVDERLYAIDEYRWDSRKTNRQLTDSEYEQRLSKWIHQHKVAPDRVFYDPSAASFGLQLWRGKWHGVTPADNDVLDGIRTTATLLSLDRLKIHERCEGLRSEMTAYRWDDKAQLRGEDKPLKIDDHGPDALRYGIANLRPVWRRWIANADRIAA